MAVLENKIKTIEAPVPGRAEEAKELDSSVQNQDALSKTWSEDMELDVIEQLNQNIACLADLQNRLQFLNGELSSILSNRIST